MCSIVDAARVPAFCARHDLILVSDEIHHDLVMPGQKHTVMAHVAGVADRLVMMTATTKTFNIAGAHIGNVIIADSALRALCAGAYGGGDFGQFLWHVYGHSGL